MAYPRLTILLCTTHWRGSVLICQTGGPDSQARLSGKVHKDGHAILCALTFAFFFNKEPKIDLLYEVFCMFDIDVMYDAISRCSKLSI